MLKIGGRVALGQGGGWWVRVRGVRGSRRDAWRPRCAAAAPAGCWALACWCWVRVLSDPCARSARVVRAREHGNRQDNPGKALGRAGFAARRTAGTGSMSLPGCNQGQRAAGTWQRSTLRGAGGPFSLAHACHRRACRTAAERCISELCGNEAGRSARRHTCQTGASLPPRRGATDLGRTNNGSARPGQQSSRWCCNYTAGISPGVHARGPSSPGAASASAELTESTGPGGAAGKCAACGRGGRAVHGVHR